MSFGCCHIVGPGRKDLKDTIDNGSIHGTVPPDEKLRQDGDHDPELPEAEMRQTVQETALSRLIELAGTCGVDRPDEHLQGVDDVPQGRKTQVFLQQTIRRVL